MKTWLIVISVIFCMLLTSCDAVASFGPETTQDCPTWCNVKGKCIVQQGSVDQKFNFNMDKWNVGKLDVTGRMVVNKPINVAFYQEDEVTVDTITTLFANNTTFVRRINTNLPGSFEVNLVEKNKSGNEIGTFFVSIQLCSPLTSPN